MTRPDVDTYFIAMARLVATRSTCPRRAVGVVLVDARRRVLSTGYNGAARGMIHCTEVPCPGASLPSGEGLDLCEAVHAEQNATLQCRDPDAIWTVYSTTSPCVPCAKLLMNTAASRIVFADDYPVPRARELWLASDPDREWVRA